MTGGTRAHAQRALYRALCRAGIHHWARERHRQALLVCCYHGLRRDDDPARHWLLMAESRFERQMAYLARHYDCVSIDEGIARLRAGPLRRPTVAVTFDDGYRSNTAIALPILRRLGIPATIYLVTDLVGTEQLLWTTRLELAFRHAPAAAHVDLTDVGGGVLTLGDEADRDAIARAMIESLKLAPEAERRAITAAVTSRLPPAPVAAAAAFALLTWDEAREAEADGLLSFGAHTCTHPILSRLDDAAVAREVGGSVRALAERLARPSRTFAFPNGRAKDFDARAIDAALMAGCTAVLTTVEELNSRADQGTPIGRITLGAGDPMASFHLRTAGFRHLLGRRA